MREEKEAMWRKQLISPGYQDHHSWKRESLVHIWEIGGLRLRHHILCEEGAAFTPKSGAQDCLNRP